MIQFDLRIFFFEMGWTPHLNKHVFFDWPRIGRLPLKTTFVFFRRHGNGPFFGFLSQTGWNQRWHPVVNWGREKRPQCLNYSYQGRIKWMNDVSMSGLPLGKKEEITGATYSVDRQNDISLLCKCLHGKQNDIYIGKVFPFPKIRPFHPTKTRAIKGS